jgi:hypothetical protein
LAGLSGDAESQTKPQLIHAIISIRDDADGDEAAPPPSSPLSVLTVSEYSSDDGGDEATEGFLPSPIRPNIQAANLLRRRATVNDLMPKMRPSGLKNNRCTSMSNGIASNDSSPSGSSSPDTGLVSLV